MSQVGMTRILTLEQLDPCEQTACDFPQASMLITSLNQLSEPNAGPFLPDPLIKIR